MTKKNITIAAIILIVGIIGVLGFLTLSPSFHNLDNLIYSKSYFVEKHEDCKADPTIFCIPKDRRYAIVQLNDNWLRPLNPIYTIVMNENKDPNGTFNNTNALVVYLKRDNIFDQSYEVEKYGYNAISNIGYEKTIELAKNYDIFSNNPDKINIRNVPSLSQGEMESNRKLIDTEDFVKNVFFASPYYTSKAKDYDSVNSSTPKDIRILKITEFLNLQEETLRTLESGKDYIYPDGSKIPNSDQAKSFLRQSIDLIKKEKEVI